MNIINYTPRQKEALNSINGSELDKLIDKAIREENPRLLAHLPLEECGELVAGKLRYFVADLEQCSRAKSFAKQEEARDRIKREGIRLSYAFGDAKGQMLQQEKEGDLFHVSDNIPYPSRFTKSLDVSVFYKWRRDIHDEWIYGSIHFSHEHEEAPDYTSRRSRKKLSAKAARDLEDDLGREWEHLRNCALYSVRDYFKKGGDGNQIPETFKAKLDPYSRTLNNTCADFWDRRF